MKNVSMFLVWVCAVICITTAVIRIAGNQDGPAIMYGIGALVCVGIFFAIGENAK